MLNGPALRRAIDLRERAYELLQWLSDAVGEGYLAFDTVHAVDSFRAGGEAWIHDHYGKLPYHARPAPHDVPAFVAFFSTYLETSFEHSDEAEEERLYEADGCACPWCSWLIDVPGLRPRTPSKADKREARELTVAVVEELLRGLDGRFRELAQSLDEAARTAIIDAVASDTHLREELALVAYATDLLARVRGRAVGPAALALWRSFAWTRAGKPRDDFVLSAELIFEAEDLLRARLERELTQRP